MSHHTTTPSGVFSPLWFSAASTCFITSKTTPLIPTTLSGPIGNWIYSTISKKLMDMCMRLEHPTSRKIWVHLVNQFIGNKSSHVVHLECELPNLVQGEMSVNDFCHQLHQLANSLTNCDAPVLERALVHQLICGLNNKFSVLKTLLLLLPKFPSFVEACELILTEEASREADNKCTTLRQPF
jgi:uncharacterized protein YigA (DUF484 family)